MQYLWAGYRIYEPFGPVPQRRTSTSTSGSGFNFGGETIFTGGNVNLNLQLKNYWYVGCGYNIQGESLSAGSLRGGPSLRYAVRGYCYWFNVQTDMRKKIRLSLFGNGGGRGDGDMRSWNVESGLTIIPSPALQISLSPCMPSNHNILQYVGTQAIGAGRPLHLRDDRPDDARADPPARPTA